MAKMKKRYKAGNDRIISYFLINHLLQEHKNPLDKRDKCITLGIEVLLNLTG